MGFDDVDGFELDGVEQEDVAARWRDVRCSGGCVGRAGYGRGW